MTKEQEGERKMEIKWGWLIFIIIWILLFMAILPYVANKYGLLR